MRLRASASASGNGFGKAGAVAVFDDGAATLSDSLPRLRESLSGLDEDFGAAVDAPAALGDGAADVSAATLRSTD
jgi:hypothetical protein